MVTRQLKRGFPGCWAWSCAYLCMAPCLALSASPSVPSATPPTTLDALHWPSQPWQGEMDLAAGDTGDGLSDVCRQLLLSNLPETYEDHKKWGKTHKRWDGLHVHREGLQIKTKRRWKEVNHGLWQMYRISPRDPAQNLHLRISNLQESRPGVVTFEVHLDAPFDAFARRARWHQGVQLFNISLEAEATAVLDAQIELKTKLDPSHFPPDVILQPRVVQATLQLRDYKVRRISKLSGDIAEEIGDSVEGLLVKQIEDKQQTKDRRPDESAD